MSDYPDPDDYAKEDCGCGHRRHAHDMTTGICRRTRMRADYSNLPPAEYAEGEDPFFSWPTNWPAPADLPYVEVPCGCNGFHYPEPPEPDEEQR